jgi:hypothetical protein
MKGWFLNISQRWLVSPMIYIGVYSKLSLPSHGIPLTCRNSTIRATAQLADNLDESVKAIKPLREELALWYTGLPMSLKSPKTDPERTTPIEPSSAACLRFAYLTLEVLLYRALLRPLGAVELEDGANVHGGEQANPSLYGELWPETQDFCVDAEQRANGQEQRDGFRDQAELIISAAEKCATIVTNFTVELMSWDFAGFWYSCTFSPLTIDID